MIADIAAENDLVAGASAVCQNRVSRSKTPIPLVVMKTLSPWPRFTTSVSPGVRSNLFEHVEIVLMAILPHPLENAGIAPWNIWHADA